LLGNFPVLDCIRFDIHDALIFDDSLESYVSWKKQLVDVLEDEVTAGAFERAGVEASVTDNRPLQHLLRMPENNDYDNDGLEMFDPYIRGALRRILKYEYN
jgi:hypothetical protein